MTKSNMNLRSTDFTVITFNELSEALEAAASGSVITITEHIEFPHMLETDKVVTLQGINEQITLTSKTKRHFRVLAGGILNINSLVLDGTDASGGIRGEAESSINISHTTIKNCYQPKEGVAILLIYGNIDISNSEFCYNQGYSVIATVQETEFAAANSIFHHNTTTSGALRLRAQNSQVESCKFYDNKGYKGAAIYTDGYSACPIITNSHFYRNSAEFLGGAIYINSLIKISDCKFYSNSAQRGGAICGESGGRPTDITNTELFHNSATVGGGAIYYSTGVSNSNKIQDCYIHDNQTSGQGGAIFTTAFAAVIISGNSVFKDNYAPRAFYQLASDYDRQIHERNIAPTVQWTEGFDYIYNNLDVRYYQGDSVLWKKRHKITLTTRYLDEAAPEHTEVYQVEDGAAFLQSFDLIDGYTLNEVSLKKIHEHNLQLSPERLNSFNVDLLNTTVSLDAVKRSYLIEIVLEQE